MCLFTPPVYHLILFLGLRCPPAAPVRQASDPLRWLWFWVAPPSESVGHSHVKLKTAVETLTNASALGSLWAHDDTQGPKGRKSHFPEHKKFRICDILYGAQTVLYVPWGEGAVADGLEMLPLMWICMITLSYMIVWDEQAWWGSSTCLTCDLSILGPLVLCSVYGKASLNISLKHHQFFMWDCDNCGEKAAGSGV